MKSTNLYDPPKAILSTVTTKVLTIGQTMGFSVKMNIQLLS